MNDIAAPPTTRSIDLDEVFPHTAEVIWKTLTNGALMARWMMEPTGFAPLVGTQFTFSTTPAGPWDGKIRCQVLEVIAHQRLAYSWRSGADSNVGYGSKLDSVVTWTLSGVEGGTRVRLVHSGFVLPRNESTFDTLGNGWPKVLPALRSLVDEQN